MPRVYGPQTDFDDPVQRSEITRPPNYTGFHEIANPSGTAIADALAAGFFQLWLSTPGVYTVTNPITIDTAAAVYIHGISIFGLELRPANITQPMFKVVRCPLLQIFNFQIDTAGGSTTVPDGFAFDYVNSDHDVARFESLCMLFFRYGVLRARGPGNFIFYRTTMIPGGQFLHNPQAIITDHDHARVWAMHCGYNNQVGPGTLLKASTATGGTSTTLVDTAATWADDQYNGKWVVNRFFEEYKQILDTVASTKTLTFATSFAVTPTNGMLYYIYDLLPVANDPNWDLNCLIWCKRGLIRMMSGFYGGGSGNACVRIDSAAPAVYGPHEISGMRGETAPDKSIAGGATASFVKVMPSGSKIDVILKACQNAEASSPNAQVIPVQYNANGNCWIIGYVGAWTNINGYFKGAQNLVKGTVGSAAKIIAIGNGSGGFAGLSQMFNVTGGTILQCANQWNHSFEPDGSDSSTPYFRFINATTMNDIKASLPEVPNTDWSVAIPIPPLPACTAPLPGMTSVKSAPYNAVGDSVHDDGPAIQAAIDAKQGRGIYFPAGNYRVVTPLHLGWNGDNKTVATTLTAQANPSDVTITVADASSYGPGFLDSVSIAKNGGGTHVANMSSRSGNVLTISPAMVGTASIGNAVSHSKALPNQYLHSGYYGETTIASTATGPVSTITVADGSSFTNFSVDAVNIALNGGNVHYSQVTGKAGNVLTLGNPMFGGEVASTGNKVYHAKVIAGGWSLWGAGASSAIVQADAGPVFLANAPYGIAYQMGFKAPDYGGTGDNDSVGYHLWETSYLPLATTFLTWISCDFRGGRSALCFGILRDGQNDLMSALRCSFSHHRFGILGGFYNAIDHEAWDCVFQTLETPSLMFQLSPFVNCTFSDLTGNLFTRGTAQISYLRNCRLLNGNNVPDSIGTTDNAYVPFFDNCVVSVATFGTSFFHAGGQGPIFLYTTALNLKVDTLGSTAGSYLVALKGSCPDIVGTVSSNCRAEVLP